MCQSDTVVDKYEYGSPLVIVGDSILVIGLGPGDTMLLSIL